MRRYAPSRGLVLLCALVCVPGCSKPVQSSSDADLHEAAAAGDLARVTLLVEEGAEVTKTDLEGATPLHVAAFNGHDNVVEYLLDHGADPNALDSNEESPLHFGVTSGSRDVVRLLIKAGADVNRGNDEGQTPLDLTEGKGGNYGELVALLRSAGALTGEELQEQEVSPETTVAPARRRPAE